MKDYTNSQITHLIDEHIHNKRDREIMSNPNQIIQHLLQSGQVPQARYQQAMQMMQGMKR